MGKIIATTGAELTSGEVNNVWSDYEGSVMLAPINNLIPDPEFKTFDPVDNALRYWNLQAAPEPTHWIPFVRDNNVQKRFSRQVSGSLPLTTDVYDISDELVPGASPLDSSETIDIVEPAPPEVTPVQVSTLIGLPAGWYVLSFGWILDEDWKFGSRVTGAGRGSVAFQLAQGQGLQFEPPTEIPANVFGLVVYLTEPKATMVEARDATIKHEQARYSVRDIPRPVDLVNPYEARVRSDGNKTFIGDKARLGVIDGWRRATDVDFVQETTTDSEGNTVNVPITTGQVKLSYRIETIQGTSFSRDPTGFITVQNNGRQMFSFRPRTLPPDARGWIPEFIVNDTWYQINKNDGGYFAPGEYANIYTSEPSNWPGMARTNTSETGGPSKEDTTGMKAPDDPPEMPIILDLMTSGLTPGMHYVKTALMVGDDEGPVSDLTAVNVPPGYGLRIGRPLIVNKLENSDVGERDVTQYNKPRAWDIKPGALIVKNSITHSDTSGSTTPSPIATTPLIPITGGGTNGVDSPVKTIALDVAIRNFVSGKLDILAHVFNSVGTLIRTTLVQSLTQTNIIRALSSDVPDGAGGLVTVVSGRTGVSVQVGGISVNSVSTTGGSYVKVQTAYSGGTRVGGTSLDVSIGYVRVVTGGGIPDFVRRVRERINRRIRRGIPRVTPQPPHPERPPQPPRQSPHPPPRPPTAPLPEIIEQIAYEIPSGGYCHVVEEPEDKPRKENFTTLDYADFGNGTYQGWASVNAGTGIQNYFSENQTSFETDVNTGIGGTATRTHSSTIADRGTFSMGLTPTSAATDEYVGIGTVHMPGGTDVWAWRARVYFPVPTRLNLSAIYLATASGTFRSFAPAGTGFQDFAAGWHTLSGSGTKPDTWEANTNLILRPAVKDGATTNDYDTTKTIYYDSVEAGLLYNASLNEVTRSSSMISKYGLRFQKFANSMLWTYVEKGITPRNSVSVMTDVFLEDFSHLMHVLSLRNMDGVDVADLRILNDGTLSLRYKDAVGAWVTQSVASGIDDKQFLSLELSYDVLTKEVRVFMGPNEYNKTEVGSFIAGFASTSQIATVFAGPAKEQTPYFDRFTVHYGQIMLADRPTVINSELTKGNYIEYFGPDGTPQNAKYGPTGLHVPAKANRTYTFGVNTWYQDLVPGSSLFHMRAKDKHGVVLQEFGSLVSGMEGDRERWERHTKTITTPPGTANIEFFANNLGGGKLKIHGLQMEDGSVATAFNSFRARSGSFSVYLNNKQPGLKANDPMVEIGRIKRLRRIFIDGHDTATTSYSARFRTANTIAELAGKPYTNDYSALSVDDNITEVNIQMSSSIDGDTPEIHSIFLDVERPYGQLLREDGTEYAGGVLVKDVTTPSSPPNMEFLQMASGAIEGVSWGSERPKRVSFSIESYRRSSAEEIMYYPLQTIEYDNKRHLVLFEDIPEFTPEGKRVEFNDGSDYFLRETADVTAFILKTEDL